MNSEKISAVVTDSPSVMVKFQESQATGKPTLTQSNQPVSHQYEPSLLSIMQKMSQIMADPQAASFSEASRTPAFNTPSMKAPECFDRTQPFKVRSLHSVLPTYFS
ncbi:hypothetical protein O181_002487 [Austropuccinia psidii MF-1]|uniref:Uncharacterized protein n=1 Tax=Austropuccinia psidii MF-1 TaxID=1389203 RepID=A0A9Q3BCK0_9BASI|nr:hypothetical protein [Austropuccinia psidii MF-1]